MTHNNYYFTDYFIQKDAWFVELENDVIINGKEFGSFNVVKSKNIKKLFVKINDEKIFAHNQGDVKSFDFFVRYSNDLINDASSKIFKLVTYYDDFHIEKYVANEDDIFEIDYRNWQAINTSGKRLNGSQYGYFTNIDNTKLSNLCIYTAGELHYNPVRFIGDDGNIHIVDYKDLYYEMKNGNVIQHLSFEKVEKFKQQIKNMFISKIKQENGKARTIRIIVKPDLKFKKLNVKYQVAVNSRKMGFMSEYILYTFYNNMMIAKFIWADGKTGVQVFNLSKATKKKVVTFKNGKRVR